VSPAPVSPRGFELQNAGAVMSRRNNLIWIDLEMSGLDVDRDLILEIAVVVTDEALEVVAEGPNIAIHQADEVLDNMDEWNTTHHGDSGLTERVRQSQVNEAEAERQVLEFLQQHAVIHRSPMCGNSVHHDRLFLRRFMPELTAFFHYRNLDISTLKELVRRWRPELWKQRQDREPQHVALQDVYDSIEELSFYREHFLRMPEMGS